MISRAELEGKFKKAILPIVITGGVIAGAATASAEGNVGFRVGSVPSKPSPVGAPPPDKTRVKINPGDFFRAGTIPSKPSPTPIATPVCPPGETPIEMGNPGEKQQCINVPEYCTFDPDKDGYINIMPEVPENNIDDDCDGVVDQDAIDPQNGWNLGDTPYIVATSEVR